MHSRRRLSRFDYSGSALALDWRISQAYVRGGESATFLAVAPTGDFFDDNSVLSRTILLVTLEAHVVHERMIFDLIYDHN